MTIQLLLFALQTFHAFAAAPAGSPVITGSAAGTNTQSVSISPPMLSGTGVNGMFSLYAQTGAWTTNYFYPLLKNGVAYQVGASTKAYCFNFTSGAQNGSNGPWQLVSATAAISANSSSISGGVYQGGASQNWAQTTGNNSNQEVANPGFYTFGSSTYTGIQTGGSGTGPYFVHIDCFEM
jgi:hypothetical protein